MPARICHFFMNWTTTGGGRNRGGLASGVTRERGTLTDARALAGYLEARPPADPELFRRTAPAWNCVDYPDGMHYLPSPDECAWCGRAKTEIAENDRQLNEQENWL